jgi:hypothetical protein
MAYDSFDEKQRRAQIARLQQGLSNDQLNDEIETEELDESGQPVKKNLRQLLNEYQAFKPEETPEYKDYQTNVKSSYENRKGIEDSIQGRMNRNDWMDVAQTLVGALSKYGASRAGMKSGTDMSGIGNLPGVDYNARNERLLRELDRQQGSAERGEQGLRDDYKTGLSTRESRLQNALKYGMQASERQRQANKDELASLLAVENQARQDKSEQGRQARFEAMESNKQTRAEEAEENRQKNTERRSILTEAAEDNKQLQNVMAEKNEALRLKSLIVNPTLGDKDKKQALLKIKGVISPEEYNELQEAFDDADSLWTFGDSKKEADKKVNELVLKTPKDIENRLKALSDKAELRQERLNILEGKAPSASPKVENKVESDEVIIEFQGTKMSIPRSDLPAALKDGAKQISK